MESLPTKRGVVRYLSDDTNVAEAVSRFWKVKDAGPNFSVQPIPGGVEISIPFDDARVYEGFLLDLMAALGHDTFL